MDIIKVSLKNFTSLHIGGEADMVVVTKEDELMEVLKYAEVKGLRVHILGSGTNTFFGDTLSNFLIIKIEIKGIESKLLAIDYRLLTIATGEIWDDVVKYAVKENLWGIENLSYIPGTVGAAPVQNIGAYGMELSNSLESVRAYDMNTHSFIELKNRECEFSYRDSLFKKNNGRYIITQVVLKLSTIPNPILTYKPLDLLQERKDISLQEIRDLVIKTRTSKLPDYTEYPNAGSFFKNPTIAGHQVESLKVKGLEIPVHEVTGGYKVPAAWLIEHVAEMKGVRVGDIGSWPVQPLVLVNYGDTTATELMDFSQSIIDIVKEKTGIILEREVNYIL